MTNNDSWYAQPIETDPLTAFRDALDQIKAVCEDNASDSCNHKMALDFVWQVAASALSSQNGATHD